MITSTAPSTSYLEEHGLVGIKKIDFKSQRPVYYEYQTIWITGRGENYMRELEKQPSISRKITVAVVSELWGAGKGILVNIATKILTDFVTH